MTLFRNEMTRPVILPMWLFAALLTVVVLACTVLATDLIERRVRELPWNETRQSEPFTPPVWEPTEIWISA
jgi:hypothetical protein